MKTLDRTEYMRKYYQENKEHIKALSKEWRDTHPAERKKYISIHRDERRSNKLKQLYGVTLEEYNVIYGNQGGVCAICGKREKRLDKRTGNAKNLSIDHDHVTGEVRGLLCINCNMAIGGFEESVDRLKSAINYLEYYKNRKNQ